MQKLRPPLVTSNFARRGWLVLVTTLVALNAHALESSQWRERARFTVAAPGEVSLALSPAVLNSAEENRADIRLLDPQGREVPFAWRHPVRSDAGSRVLRVTPDVRLADRATVITVSTNTDQPLDSLTLETAPGDFLKAASVEASSDGVQWETLGTGLPLFRREGTTRLTIPLKRVSATTLRVTLDDRQTPPVAITGASLGTSAAIAVARTAVQPVRIVQREEFAGETVLTLDLGAAHLTVLPLEVKTDEPVFNRAVTLTERSLVNDGVVERELAQGTLSRRRETAVGDWARMSAGMVSAPREVIMHIANGDSPPLALDAIQVRRLQREVVFTAREAGAWTVLAGNPTARAPRYDVGGVEDPASVADVTSLETSGIEANPVYQAPLETLAGLPLTGAPLDTAAWKFRRPILMSGPESGVLQLELDLPVIAKARGDLADLRLISDGKQIPFLIEASAQRREFDLTIKADDDPKSPRTSRWRLTLPQAGLPLNRLAFSSPTALFDRRVRLFEEGVDERGQPWRRLLSDARWRSLPDSGPATLVCGLDQRLENAVLTLEADNGDNPPIVLNRARAAVKVTRLFFKPAPGAGSVELVYGNPQADAPHYDLSLVAPQLLKATKVVATLGPEAKTTASREFLSGRGVTLFFWAVLALVVVSLLVIVARLLPKPAGEKTERR